MSTLNLVNCKFQRNQALLKNALRDKFENVAFVFSCDRKTVKNEACGKANVTVSFFIFGGKMRYVVCSY